MKITFTKAEFMHGRCNEKTCPFCTAKNRYESNIDKVDEYIKIKLTVIKTGAPKSPWWDVKEDVKQCYQKLRGNLRHKGFYDD